MMNVAGIPTDEVVIMGWPWHGQVRSAINPSQGEVVLPNGTTREHPVPERPWNTYRVRVPGTPMVTRTPEQLAADAAAGRSWWSQAILCGSSFQLYGRDLGGWLYCAPDGTRWIINLDAGTARRMGEVGGSAVLNTISVSWPADNGQGSPAIDWGTGDPDVYVWRHPVPCDISPDGRRAVLMLYANDPSPLIMAGERPIPLGFLLVEISGSAGEPFTATVTVLHTRSETLGTLTYQNDMTVTHGPSGVITSTGQVNQEQNGRIRAVWFGPTGDLVRCYVDRRDEEQAEFAEPNFGYRRRLSRWRLRVGETLVAEARLEGTYESLTPGTPTDSGTVRYIGRLNGQEFYNQVLEGVQSASEPPAPLTVAQQAGPSSAWGPLILGEKIDVLHISNNMVVFYVRTTEDGVQFQHHYIGAATPASADSPVVVNESDQTSTVPSDRREILYGPRSYSSWNPVTHVAAPLAATPVGWI